VSQNKRHSIGWGLLGCNHEYLRDFHSAPGHDTLVMAAFVLAGVYGDASLPVSEAQLEQIRQAALFGLAHDRLVAKAGAPRSSVGH
jgi:hypothetical protein